MRFIENIDGEYYGFSLLAIRIKPFGLFQIKMKLYKPLKFFQIIGRL
jgi:hypothetical protein